MAWKKELVPRNNSGFINQVSRRSSWAHLPCDLLFMIFSRFQDIYNYSFLDLYQCLAVCRSWQFVAKRIWQNKILSTTPWLLIPFQDTRNMVAFNTNLYMCHDGDDSVVTTNTTKNPSLRCSLPDIGYRPSYSTNYKIAIATYGGWLLLHAPVDYQYYLYNPITGFFLRLPRLPRSLVIGVIEYIKFVLSRTSPADPNCIICLKCSRDRKSIHRSKSEDKSVLALCNPASSSSWVLLDDNVEDMIFYRGKLYTIDNDGALLVYNDDDVTGNTTVRRLSWREKKIAEAVSSRDDQEWFRFFYLVESKSGELLMIKRIFDTNIPLTISFRIFKLNFGHKNCHEYYCWEEIDNLQENESLYLGWNEFMSISVNDNDVRNTYKPNCIYFFDQLFEGQSLEGPLIAYRGWDFYDVHEDYITPGRFTGHGMYDLENHTIKYKYFDEEDKNIDPPGQRSHCLLFSPAKLSNV